MPHPPEAPAVPRSGVALGLLAAGVVLFVIPLTLAIAAAASGGARAVTWGVTVIVAAGSLWRVSRLGIALEGEGLVVRNPLRTIVLPWVGISTIRWQCLKAGALDRILPPNCRLLIERPDGTPVAVQATVHVTAEQRDAIERIVRTHAPPAVQAFTRQSPDASS